MKTEFTTVEKNFDQLREDFKDYYDLLNCVTIRGGDKLGSELGCVSTVIPPDNISDNPRWYIVEIPTILYKILELIKKIEGN